MPDGAPEELGRRKPGSLGVPKRFDESERVVVYGRGRTILARALPVREGRHDRVVGRHEADDVRLVWRASKGDQIVSIDGEGEIRIWSLSAPGTGPVRVIPRPEGAPAPYRLFLDPTGRWVYRIPSWDA